MDGFGKILNLIPKLILDLKLFPHLGRVYLIKSHLGGSRVAVLRQSHMCKHNQYVPVVVR